MPRRKHTAEEIIDKLREAGVVIASGSTLLGQYRCGGRPSHWGLGTDLLSLAERVRWPSRRPGPAPEAVGDREQPAQAGGGRAEPGQPDSQGSRGGKLLSPDRRRLCVQHVRSVLGISERRACKVLEKPRSTQRRELLVKDDEQALTNDIVTD